MEAEKAQGEELKPQVKETPKKVLETALQAFHVRMESAPMGNASSAFYARGQAYQVKLKDKVPIEIEYIGESVGESVGGHCDLEIEDLLKAGFVRY